MNDDRSTPRIELRLGRTGLYRFVVISRNGEIVATSEHYTTKQGAKRGLAALRESVGNVITIVDTTRKATR